MRYSLYNIKLMLFLTLVAFTACKKTSIETNYNPNLQVANNQVIAERAYSQVFNIFFRVVTDTTLKNTGSNKIFGAECTYQETPEIEYVIDYLSYYTPCPDGKVRKGKITATLDKDFNEPGAVATLVFDNYVVNDLWLEGDNFITNDEMGMHPEMTFIHEVPSATLTFYDTVAHGSIQWTSLKTFIFSAGMDTPDDHEDDVFEITGSASGTDIDNIAFSTQIDTALGNYLNCRWIRTGRTSLSTPGLEVQSGYIDYIGDDNCTNQVLYYFNGNPFYDRFDKH